MDQTQGGIPQKITTLYQLGMDSVTLNAQGAEPIREELARIAAIKNDKELAAMIATLHREGIFLSAFGVCGRLSGLVIALALASLTWFFGFESGASPGPQPDVAFRFYLSVYPAVLLGIGAIIARVITVPGAAASPESVAAVAEELGD